MAPNPTQKRRRSPSIEWDIEKDVDDVDVDSIKKRLVDEDAEPLALFGLSALFGRQVVRAS